MSDKTNWPDWLRDADTEGATVNVSPSGYVTWHGGTWRGGVWYGGVWHGGTWIGGEWISGVWYGGGWHGGTWRDGGWRGGEWRGGVWHGGGWHGGTWRDGGWHGGGWISGEWHGGEWHGGEWISGVWYGGEWHGGEWRGGTWRDPHIVNRVVYMASLAGVTWLANGRGVAYRSTRADGRGRYCNNFIQTAGRVDVAARPAGEGTCVAGLHATSAARAFYYFGIDPTAQLWRVEFEADDLLDCDGEKIRLRGAWCEKVAWPWQSVAA